MEVSMYTHAHNMPHAQHGIFRVHFREQSKKKNWHSYGVQQQLFFAFLLTSPLHLNQQNLSLYCWHASLLFLFVNSSVVSILLDS